MGTLNVYCWFFFVSALIIGLALPVLAVDLVEVKNIEVGSQKPYKVADKSLDVGDVYYIDRQYTIISMPVELKGGTWIMTANDDKQSVGNGFLKFEVKNPVTVYVLRDSRGDNDKGGSPPQWLSDNFEKVKDWKVEVTDSNMGFFTVWKSKADFPAGKVELGGNADPPAAGQGSHYVVVLFVGKKGLSVGLTGKLSTTWAKLKNER